jgi:hypothetical protein
LQDQIVGTGTFAGNQKHLPASASAKVVINQRTLTVTPDGGKTKILRPRPPGIAFDQLL